MELCSGGEEEEGEGREGYSNFWGFGFSITLLVHAMPRALEFTLREWFYDTYDVVGTYHYQSTVNYCMLYLTISVMEKLKKI